MKFTKFKFATLALTIAASLNLAAEQEVRVKDFIDANENKQGLTVFNQKTSISFEYNGQDSLIIAGRTPEDGERPWIVSGSNEAFMLTGEYVKDLEELAKIDNQVFFVADSPTLGKEIFTVVGDQVELVHDIRASGNSNPEQLTELDGFIYFVANDGDGLDVWRTSGEVTEKVTNLSDGDSVDSIDNLTPFGGWLYFTANTSSEGNELYRTNGNEVIQHTDLGANDADGVQLGSELVVYDDRLFLSAFFIEQTGFEMHFVPSDHGAPALFAELVPGSDSTTIIQSMVGDDNELYWIIDAAGSQELWHYNGVDQPIKKIAGGETNLFATFDGGVYFTNDTLVPINGTELYKFTSGIISAVNGVDGEIAEIYAGEFGSSPRDPLVVGNDLYFIARTTEHGRELLKLAAGSSQAELVYEQIPGLASSSVFLATAVGQDIYVTTGRNRRLGKFDTTNMTVTDVNPTQLTGVDSMITHVTDGLMIEYQNKLYFTAYTEEKGTELWVYDGESEQIVHDIYTGPTSSNPSNFVIYQDALYFVANSESGGREVWRTDGVTTEQAFEINVGAETSNPSYLTNHNDLLFFRATSEAKGYEIFATNGTDIEIITDIVPDQGSSNPSDLTSFNGSLWFTAHDENDGFELWQIDEFMVVIKHEIGPGNVGSNPSRYYVSGDRMFFTADDGHGKELWAVNEAEAISMLDDINPDEGDATPLHLTTDIQGNVYFTANNGVNRRLYRTFGSSVIEANASPEGDFTDLEYVQDRFYAVIDNPETGKELYGKVGNDFALLDETINGPFSNLSRLEASHNSIIGIGQDKRSYVLNIINHAEADWSFLSHENNEEFSLFPFYGFIEGYDFGKNFVVPACNNKLGCELFSIYFNEKPNAAIAGPVEAHSGVEVVLDGTDSVDSDGEVESYTWIRVSGPLVVLPNNNSGSVSFTAPDLSGEEDLVVRLEVTDNDGAKSNIEHTIKIFNAAPVAIINVNNANPEVGQQVTLDGSASTDDSLISSYAWSQISGPAVTLNNANASVASFTAIDVESDTLVEFQLTVTDENGISHSQTVGVVISPKQSANQAPTAVISVSNLSPTSGSLVTLNSAASSDTDGSITSYEWAQLDGIAISLDNNNQVVTSFIAPDVQEPTIVTIQLAVVDDAETSSQATVQIQVMPAEDENLAPNAVINVSNNNPETDEQVVMDASNSSDSDGAIVSYQWQQVAGDAVTINGSDTAIASFTAAEVEQDSQLQFQLTITDDEGASVVSSVFINLQAKPNVLPIANITANNMNPVSGTGVSLNGTGSMDGDGQIVSYQWTQTAGPQVSINNADGPVATFTAPIVQSNTMISFKLTVTDDDGAIAEKEISLTVLPQFVPGNGSNGNGNGGSTNLILVLVLMVICMGRRRY